jgi:N-acetyl-gamma-glutamyl-phosphate/LysW-gamma-L-alpha-aminoadipyl-6-phosphate reductase
VSARVAAPAPARAGAPASRGDVTDLWLFGARGLLGGELLRFLEGHSGLAPAALVSRAADDVATAHPHLAPGTGANGWPVCDAAAAEERLVEAAADRDVAIALALPAGESAATWARLRARLGADADRAYVVDLSPDHRLRDPALHRAAYGAPPPDADERARFVYGLPELGRDAIRGARRVAAPGCFATALQLAVVPAARGPWFLSGITGSSGSGVDPKAGTHHPHRHDNLWAYGIDGHRHEAELRQALEGTGLDPEIRFLPHSGPFARGIHLTACLPLARPLGDAAATALFADAYAGEPFVRVLADGVPALRQVTGSASAALRAFVRGSVLHVLVTLDNLGKGGAGQALQCLNLMLGFPETRGLPRSGLGVS